MTEVYYSLPSCYGSGHMLDPTMYSNLAMIMIICALSATIQWSPTGRPRRLEMLLLKDVLLSCEYCTKCFQFSMHYSDVWGLTDNII